VSYFLGQGELPAQIPAWLSPLLLTCSLLCLFLGVLAAVHRTPAWLKDEERARRHADLSPQQAAADLGRALKLAPKRRHTELLEQRARLYEKLGRGKDASRDRLAVAGAPGTLKGDAMSATEPGGKGAEADAISRGSGQLKALVASGQAMAVGYCPRCKTAAELDGRLRCPIHHRTRGRGVRYVVPDDVEAGKEAVLRERSKRRSRRRWRALGAAAALALVALAWLVIDRFADIGELIPNASPQSEVNATSPVVGPGAAGFGTVEQMRKLKVNWYYEFGDCRKYANCLPMTRAGCPWQPEYSVRYLMRTCGALPCNGVLIGNEPYVQDVCNATCQAEQLHDHAPEARAVNPNATVIFGNYAWPQSWQLTALSDAWARRYPNLPLATFMRDNNVRIGVHQYPGAEYKSQSWRTALLAFRADVKRRWNVDIVLTEYGSYDSGARWKQVINEQTRWLRNQGIPAAAFYGGSVDTWGCCPMTKAGGTGLTQYGQLYARLNTWASVTTWIDQLSRQ
jgi:hypothetical protein